VPSGIDLIKSASKYAAHSNKLIHIAEQNT